jgi:hypothetical protein
MACDIYYQNPAYFQQQLDGTMDNRKLEQFFTKYANGFGCFGKSL